MLTAGLATRLRPLSWVRAKAALPIGDDVLARRILRQLAAAGIQDSVLNLHHLPETLTSRIGDGSDLGLRVRYSWEAPRVLGSAGGPRRALPLLEASTFFIVNGDTLTNVDFGALLGAHRASGALVTLAVIPNREPGKYSGLALTADGAMRGVIPRGAAAPSFHFVGVQVAERAAFEALEEGVPCESVGALYPRLIGENPGCVRAYVCEADFMDIGTPADYLDTALAILAADGLNAFAGAGTAIAADARIERSILWDNVTVGEGAALRECVVTDGAVVPAHTSWHGVAIRRATGPLAEGERVIGSLAIAAL